MSKKDDIQYIDPNKIIVNFGLPDNPEKDDKLIELFRKAHEKKIPVYVGDIYIDKIKPFCAYKPKQQTLDSIKERYLQYVQDGEPQSLHVYPDGEFFIMSDDYAAYFTYLNAGLKTAPCIIFGETDSGAVLNKRKIDWSL